MAKDLQVGKEDRIDNLLEKTGDIKIDRKKDTKSDPIYRIVADSKIPVAKSTGRLWRSRRDQAISALKNSNKDSAWEEAIRYYRNDQTTGGTRDGTTRPRRGGGTNPLTDQYTETENIVYANCSILKSLIYAKNPMATVTPIRKENEAFAMLCQRLIKVLAQKKAAPGIGLKSKGQRCVLSSFITNVSYIEIGYTFRAESSEEALAEINKLGKQLAEAKNSKEIEEIEGKLQSLDEKIDLLRPAGPTVRFRSCFDVLVDPDSTEEDLSDANWVMIKDYISTSYLRAVYMERAGKDFVSLYEPTHVVSPKSQRDVAGHDDEIISYKAFQTDSTDDYKSHGFDDAESLQRAQRTKCWWVWDRTTHRVLLFSDMNWTWPLWVWDDPYNLDTFFPIYPLIFNQDPLSGAGRSEVNYYMDQQDAINEINSERRRARAWAARNVFFDSNSIREDDAQKLISGTDNTFVGIKVPDGKRITEMVFSVPPPSAQFMQMFDKVPILEAIDRVSSVQSVARGTEFKTNTTNKAIETYQSNAQTRQDERIDAVEDFLGAVLWGVLQLCIQFMEPEMVADLLGAEVASSWRNMNAEEIRANFSLEVVGGSTVKPTSATKQRQALELGQVLGQFVKAAPAPVMITMLKVMERAFDEIVLKDEDWKFIKEHIEKQVAAEQQGDPLKQLDQLMSQLPPQAQQAIGRAVAQGIPISKAVQEVMQIMQQQQQGQPVEQPQEAPQQEMPQQPLN